jgi:hypothetical protein
MHPLMTWSGRDPARPRESRADSAYPSQAGFQRGEHDVRKWHLTDMLSGSLNVRFQVQSGLRVTL